MTSRIKLAIIAALAILVTSTVAHAQGSATTGGLRGVITDQATGNAVEGATVVITGPKLQGQQLAITDGSGQYVIPSLPPGTYILTVYVGEAQFNRPNVLIQLGKTAKVNVAVDTSAQKGEVIEIQGTAPLIDQDSSKTGVSITSDYTQNIPTGRTFGAVLSAAAGSQGDAFGFSFSGSTSPENVYIIDGINTTDPGFGLQGTNLPTEFVSETEVVTGGYNAEFGRATGGLVNVVTKSGSNEFHGSVFGYWTPGALRATPGETPRAGSSIDTSYELSNAFDFGAEIGGPILRDKLWFHAGINPSFAQRDAIRVLKTQVDANNDGVPDLDENGFGVLQEIDGTEQRFGVLAQQYYFTGKLTGAVTPDHQGQISVFGNPGTEESYGRRNLAAPSLTGRPDYSRLDTGTGAYDVSAKWTSKFNNNQTQIDAVAGWHRNVDIEEGASDASASPRVVFINSRPLSDFEAMEPNFSQACVDGGADDPYPNITNCPVSFYDIGGFGFIQEQDARRTSASLALTQRVKAAGHHTFKIGGDVELNAFSDTRGYTGGIRYIYFAPDNLRVDQIYTIDADGESPCGRDVDLDGMPDGRCARQPGGLDVDTDTRNISWFIQDSWAIMPNLTVNAGVRWEQQELFVAEDLQGELAPDTGEPFPEKAFTLTNLLAPRIGAIWDPTKEGRSKIYGHWGRFYESVPMDLNSRVYGGEVANRVNIDPTMSCPDPANPLAGMCTFDENEGVFLGGGSEDAVDNLTGQYIDSWVIGGEYEVMADTKVGAYFTRKQVGNVLEDLSPDSGGTYIIANPGRVDTEKVADLRSQADAAEAAGNMDEAAALREEAQLLANIALFDKPVRDYNAITVTVDRRFSKNVFALASYTYSQTRGNYPGLFSHETNQLDPNITSLYDLPELMANRYGDLGSDRPHLLKVDGYYRLPVQNVGDFTLGARIRGSSGIPINTLGGHPFYGTGEAYILPRGTGGRVGFTTQFDANLAYARQISDTVRAEGFISFFNVFNQKPTLRVEEDYTFDDVNPIVGGDEEDLAHAKALGSGRVVTKNPNYGNATVRQAPFTARIGFRLTF